MGKIGFPGRSGLWNPFYERYSRSKLETPIRSLSCKSEFRVKESRTGCKTKSASDNMPTASNGNASTSGPASGKEIDWQAFISGSEVPLSDQPSARNAPVAAGADSTKPAAPAAKPASTKPKPKNEATKQPRLAMDAKQLSRLLEFRAEVNEVKTTKLHQSMSLKVLQDSVKLGGRYSDFKGDLKSERLQRLEEKHMSALCGLIVYTYNVKPKTEAQCSATAGPAVFGLPSSDSEDAEKEANIADKPASHDEIKKEVDEDQIEPPESEYGGDSKRRRSKKPKRFIDQEEVHPEQSQQVTKAQSSSADTAVPAAPADGKKKRGRKRKTEGDAAIGSLAAKPDEEKKRRKSDGVSLKHNEQQIQTEDASQSNKPKTKARPSDPGTAESHAKHKTHTKISEGASNQAETKQKVKARLSDGGASGTETKRKKKSRSSSAGEEPEKRKRKVSLSDAREAGNAASESKQFKVKSEKSAESEEPKRKVKVKIADANVEEAECNSIYCGVCGCLATLISLQGKLDLCKTCYTAFLNNIRSVSQESELECSCKACGKCRTVTVLRSGIDLSTYTVARGFPSWVSRRGEQRSDANVEMQTEVKQEDGGKRVVKIKKASVESPQKMGTLYESVGRVQMRQCVQSVTGDTGKVSIDVPQEMSSRAEAWRDGVAVFGASGSLPELSEPQCLLCGSGGAEKDLMVRCSCCAEQFHLYCLSVCERPLWSSGVPWRCVRCAVCRVCKRSGGACRSCIKCAASYHPSCLAESKGYRAKDWQLCNDCAGCKHCGKRFSPDAWSEWDNLCQHCEGTEVRCHECHRLTSLIGNSLACSTDGCKNVVHATCAGINDELYHVYLVNDNMDFFCKACDSRGFHALKASCERDLRARIRALSESLGLPSAPQQLDGVLEDIDDARQETAAEKIFCRMPAYQEFKSGHDLVKAIIVALIASCKFPGKLTDCALLSAALDKGVAALFSWLSLSDLRAEVLGEATFSSEIADADSVRCELSEKCKDLCAVKLAECSSVDGAGVCELCGEKHQDKVVGRLLPCARASWIHVGCALFSPEVRMDESDCCLGVRAAVRRAKGNRCSDCGKVGASIDCSNALCPRVCHLSCAANSGWKFSDLCESACSECKASFAGAPMSVEQFGRVLCRRVVIGSSDQSLCEVSLAPEQVSARIGNLLVSRLGTLKQTSGALGTVLLPVGYRAQKQFWSVREAGKVSNYEWILKSDSGKVRFLLVSHEESVRLCSSHPITVMRRLCQMVTECWSAQISGRKPLLLPGNGWSSVGVVHPRMIWCLEQLGFCPGYTPKYLIQRWAQLRKQQMSENASGCARSEALQARCRSSAPSVQLKRTFSFLLSSARRPLALDVQQQQQQVEELSAVSTLRNQMRVARNEHWQCRVQVLPSAIHGLGLFAVRPFAKNEFIVEYTGEMVRASLAEAKEHHYRSRNIDCYLFKVNWQWMIDASVKGGPARFVNHSCAPNCATRTLEQRILIVAKREISAGEELTYDYRFDKEEDKVACHCSSLGCRKFLN